MDVTTESAPSAARPRVWPILERLVPDPCREWIDSPDDTLFDWGEFRYCRQRRDGSLTAFVGLTGYDLPDRFAPGEKTTWSPTWSREEPWPNTARQFELWCAQQFREGSPLPVIDGRMPAMGVDSWRGCSGGGGSRPYHILVERDLVHAHLAQMDGEGEGLHRVRCGLAIGDVCLLFPRLSEYLSPCERKGFSFLVRTRDAVDQLGRRSQGMAPKAAAAVARDMLALHAFLEDSDIATLTWP